MVFESTDLNQQDRTPLSLTPRQEQVLFKYAALKGHGQIVSWGKLLFSWSNYVENGQQICDELQQNCHFDKLLISKKGDPPKRRMIKTSFQDFVVQQIIDLLVHHPKSLLPSGLLERRLASLLSQFVSAQQDVLFYMDHLHLLCRGADTPFPFDDALKLLKEIITDHSTPIYNFLHASLHYFHCMVKFKIDKLYASFVFEAIDSLSKEERQLYDRWLNEKHPRGPFEINDTFVKYIRTTHLPLTELGSIILKFSRTVRPEQKEDQGQPLRPYISAEKHIKVLRFVEGTFGKKIPELIYRRFFILSNSKFTDLCPPKVTAYNPPDD